MTEKEILSKVDHTNLKQLATFADIQKLCDEAMAHGVASVCIPPNMVKSAKEYVGDKMAVCTVIGFPNGYNSTATKVYETTDAINNGADEIDMVIAINWLQEGKTDLILQEIDAIKQACGTKILKVIIETCLLTEQQKIQMCEVLNQSKADFIKTSTGFSTAGATLADIKLMRKHCQPHIQIKAAGGIASFEDGADFITAGATRLGTSRLINDDKKSY